MNLLTKTLAALALAFTPLAHAIGPDWTAADWIASGLGAINPGTAGVPSPGAAFQEAAIEGDGLVIMGDGSVVSGAGIHVYNDHGDGAWKVTTAGAPVPVVLNGTPQFEGTFGVFVGTRQVGQLNGASAFTLVYSTPRAASVPDAFGRTGIQNMTFDAACNVVFPDPCTAAVKAACTAAGNQQCVSGSATCGPLLADPCTAAAKAACVASGRYACVAGSATCGPVDPCTSLVRGTCTYNGFAPCTSGSATCGPLVDVCSPRIKASCATDGLVSCVPGSADCGDFL